MTIDPLVLYVDSNFASPYALSAFVALTEKGLPFEVVKLDLKAGQHKTADYAASSITGRVPSLRDGEFSLAESSAIDEYLEERFPPPQFTALYPRELRARARARQIQAWLRSDLMPIRQERSTEVIFVRPTDKPLSADAQAAAQRLFGVADALLKSGEPNLFGDWCIADTDFALMLNRLVLNGDAVPEKVATYARRQWQRPSVQQWVANRRAT